MDMPAPQKEHRWLQKMVGEWTAEGEGSMGTDQPPMTWKGTESVRAIGEFWIVAEAQGEMPGGSPATNIVTLGYNPQKERFVGTFFSSMMPRLWLYEGALDAAERVLTLDTEGPSMTVEGETARYQDVMEIFSDDHRVLTSLILGTDGQWQQIMTTHYRRTK